jgi:hypothetical protein
MADKTNHFVIASDSEAIQNGINESTRRLHLGKPA